MRLIHKAPRVGVLVAAIAACFAMDAQANPTGPAVVSGQVSILRNANLLQITNSPGSIINWQSFSIGAGEITRFIQQSSASAVLNRVTTQNPSSILGSLQSNGRVFLLNPSGIVFGPGSQVNVGGLVASSLNLSDADFLGGRLNFTQTPGAGSIVNQGTINTAQGGSVYLVGPAVSNSGIITSPKGEVVLAAGNSVQLVDPGTPNLRVEITAPDNQATNLGQIVADSGRVGIYAGLIDHSGTIRADSVDVTAEGHIILKATKSVTLGAGSLLSATGTNGANGGFIETSAEKVSIDPAATVITAAPQGKTGTWLIDPNDYTIASSGGDITGSQLSTNLGSNNVTIISSGGGTAGSGDINVNDAVSWSANTLTLTAARDVNINAVMTPSGTSALALNTATANGADGAVAGGTVKAGFAADGTFAGRVDFGTRSGTGFLTINGNSYTVINGLGAQGSVTGADLQGMSGNLTGFYALGSNIDATATSGWNSGTGFLPVGDATANFTGTLDGLGHTIAGLTINASTSIAGLFGASGFFTNGVTIRNVGLAGGSISGTSIVGGLLGEGLATITNSYVTSTVNGTGWDVGGLAGAVAGAITNSYSSGNVTSPGYYVGGLVGAAGAAGGTITNSYSTGSVTGNGSGWYVGGLAGINANSGIITNSYSTGAVTNSGNYTGGLVGSNDTGTITNSYSTGSVSGSWFVGGLAGMNTNSGTITNSYSAGAVSGSGIVGGLVGANGATVTNSYWDTQTSGQATSAGGTGLSTAQMMTQANFTGWDFTNTWRIYEGHTYPLLKSFLAPLIVTANAATKTEDGLAYSGGNGVSYSVASPVLSGTLVYGGTSQGAVNAGSYTIVPSGYYSTKYDISYANGVLTVTAAPATNTWLGLVDSNWTTVGNWSLGHVPAATDTVVIPVVGGTAFVQISGGAFVVKSLTSAELFKLTGAGTSVALTSSGSFNAGLDLGAGTSLTSQGALSLSSYTLGAGAKINLTQSGTGILTIAGFPYTVINSLGAAGSVTGVDLQGMQSDTSGGYTRGFGYYALGSNIDASATSGWNGGAGFMPVGNDFAVDGSTHFIGIFDGLGHTITGLTIKRVGIDVPFLFGNPAVNQNVGLFGYAGRSDVPGTLIRNVGLINGSVTATSGANGPADYVGGLAGNIIGSITNSYFTGSVSGADYVGGLAGRILNGTISNSYSTASVSGTAAYVGGLAGYNYHGTITDSYATGKVTGSSYVLIDSTETVVGTYDGTGGLVGYNDAGTITNSSATGNVSGTLNVGGLVGVENGGTITNAYSTGNVTGSDTDFPVPGNPFAPWVTVTADYAGGLVGHNGGGTITGSYSTGSVSGTDHVGGLVGAHDTGSISNSYSTGSVSGIGDYVGGLAGVSDAGTITNSYARGNVSETFNGDAFGHYTDVGGLVGYNHAGSITDSYSTGSVSGTGSGAGGLVGYDDAGTITNSYSTGSVSGGRFSVGGLVGEDHGGSITNSYSTGSVTGTLDDVGGLVGYNSGTITNAYSIGSVSASGTGDYVGGLVGNNDGTISDSYHSRGSVTGRLYVGGLAGGNGGAITSSYWDTQASGKSNCVGLGGSTGCTGLTTSQMKQQTSFSGWDFSAVWAIDENVSSPYLRANEQIPHPSPGNSILTAIDLLGSGATLPASQIASNLAIIGRLSAMLTAATGTADAAGTSATDSPGTVPSCGARSKPFVACKP